MDYAIVIKWLIPVLVRGVAWVLAAKLGFAAVESQDLATQIGAAVGALAILSVSIYTSVKGRQKLLNTPPPVKP